MKTYNTVAIETDINGVDSNEELNALFTRALELCQTAKPLQAIHRSSPSSTLYLSSQNITDCLQEEESVDLKPNPLPEIDFVEVLESVQVNFIKIKQEKEYEIENTVNNDSSAVVGNDDGSVGNGLDEINHLDGVATCPRKEICDKLWRTQAMFNKHIITFEERSGSKGQESIEEAKVIEHNLGGYSIVESGEAGDEDIVNMVKQGSVQKQNNSSQNLKEKESKGKKQICFYCNKDCHFKSALEIHVRTHTNEKPFQCQYCYKTFTTNGSLKEHTLRHVQNIPCIKCSFCDKTFQYTSILNQHLRTHTGERPYKCELCEKAFKTKKAHIEHLKTHTRKRPFKCHFCDSAFMRRQHLTKHLQSHTRETPHKCEFCEKSFTKWENFVQHLQIHLCETT